MPTGTTQSNSLIPSTQQSPGSVRVIASNLRSNAAQSKDASLWSSAGDALGSIQGQLDHIWQALQTNIPIPDPFQVYDANGNLVAEIGDFVDPVNSTAYEGIWCNNLFAGGSGPGEALLIVTENGVTVNAALTLNDVTLTETSSAGTLVISPVGPSIAITNTSGETIVLTTNGLNSAPDIVITGPTGQTITLAAVGPGLTPEIAIVANGVTTLLNNATRNLQKCGLSVDDGTNGCSVSPLMFQSFLDSGGTLVELGNDGSGQGSLSLNDSADTNSITFGPNFYLGVPATTGSYAIPTDAQAFLRISAIIPGMGIISGYIPIC